MALRRLLAVRLLAYHVHPNSRRHQGLSAENELHHELVHQLRADLQEQQGLQKVTFRANSGHDLAEKIQKGLQKMKKDTNQSSNEISKSLE